MIQRAKVWLVRFIGIARALITSPCIWALYWLSGHIPRRRDVWAFGVVNNGFFDNSKYLYLHVSRNLPLVEAFWISDDSNIVSRLQSAGLKAERRTSFRGILVSLRAKFHFYSYYPSDVSYFTSRNAVLFNLWHGSPLKKIEFDIAPNRANTNYVKVGILARLFGLDPSYRPDAYMRPSFVLSGSEFVSSYCFSSAFRVPISRCLPLGYPRNDALSYTHHDLLDSAALLGETALFAVLQRLKDFPHVILYLPTYRDDGGDFLAGACFDFYALNEMCKRLNAVFVVKWHLATNLHTDKYESGLRDLDNIVVLDPAVSDVMPIMSLSSILVTDYSSAMFDFLLLRRPIIRFCFDEDAYRSARDFYEAPIANLPGCKVMDFPQLLDSLQSTLASRQPEGGSEQILRQYNQNLDHDACFSVARFASNLD